MTEKTDVIAGPRSACLIDRALKKKKDDDDEGLYRDYNITLVMSSLVFLKQCYSI